MEEKLLKKYNVMRELVKDLLDWAKYFSDGHYAEYHSTREQLKESIAKAEKELKET